jgi:hypothetical protein
MPLLDEKASSPNAAVSKQGNVTVAVGCYRGVGRQAAPALHLCSSRPSEGDAMPIRRSRRNRTR